MSAAVELLKHRFTVDAFHAMAASGGLDADARLELIDGEVYRMAPIGNRHALLTNLLTEWLIEQRAPGTSISPQNPLVLDDHTELYPDLCVLALPHAALRTRLPKAADALLVIEIADSSVQTDRRIKLPRYLAAGIPEVWLVDLPGRLLEVHRPGLGPEQHRSGRVSAGKAQACVDVDQLFEGW